MFQVPFLINSNHAKSSQKFTEEDRGELAKRTGQVRPRFEHLPLKKDLHVKTCELVFPNPASQDAMPTRESQSEQSWLIARKLFDWALDAGSSAGHSVKLRSHNRSHESAGKEKGG